MSINYVGSDSTQDHKMSADHSLVIAPQPRRLTLKGVVVSDKMDKTVVVAVNRRYAHPKYKKIVSSTKRYFAHDEHNAYKGMVGKEVTIRSCRPRSKKKSFEIIS